MRSSPGAPRLSARIPVRALVMLALLIVPWLAPGRDAVAAPEADRSRAIGSLDQGDSLTDPAPLQSETTAGPWRMTVQEVVFGDEANTLVTGASAANQAPNDGSAYVAVRVTVTNAGTVPVQIDSDDFAVVDSAGLVRRFAAAVAPDPALTGVIAAGESLDGWVVGVAPAGDAALVLLYDSKTLTGNWADVAFALSDGAALAALSDRALAINETGRQPGDPAGFNAQVATDDWVVEVLEVISGADIVGLFPDADYRTTALESSSPGASATWIGFRVRITNNRTGDLPAHLSETAFTLADGDGNPVPDLSTLTSPEPELATEYVPGASREGWILFDAVGYDGALLRFASSRTDGDPRYFTWDGSGTTTPSEPSFAGTLEPGTAVVTTEDLVRMRSQPTTESEIVVEMPVGTVLTVTGAPEEGEGFTWYPVENPETGETGYVAQQLIEPAD